MRGMHGTSSRKHFKSICLNKILKTSHFWIKTEQVLFIIFLVAHLLPLWAVKYFLTTDGPSHVYNAKVLLDFFTSHNVDFYQTYYAVNAVPNPNWFSHLSLSFLQFFLPGFVAEKVFLSVYVILFVFAIRKLVAHVNKENLFLSWIGFPFIYNYVLQLGFYNSLFSMVLMLLTIYVWVVVAEKSKMKILMLTTLFTLLYFTHLVGLSFAIFFIALIIPFQQNWHQSGISSLLSDLAKKYAGLAATAFPAFILAIYYFNNMGTGSLPSPDSTKKLYHDFLELSSLFCMVGREKPFLIATSIGFGILVLYAFYCRISKRKISQADGFFLCFIAGLIIYFNQPGGMAGGFLLKQRLQIIPFIILLPWLATAHYPNWMKKWVCIFFSIASLILIGIRLPHHVSASKAVEEIVSAEAFIKNKSTILPLSFSFNGKTVEGEYIANKVWLFAHAADYLGCGNKAFIMLGNYEANTPYFPLKWKVNKNPFSKLGIIEGFPPDIDISGYSTKTGSHVDYVMTLFLDEDNEFVSHPNTKNLLAQLSESYELVYRSESERIKLYKRKIL